MRKRTMWLMNAVLGGAMVFTAMGAAGAQQLRRSAPPTDGARSAPAGTATSSRFPFAGTWSGTRTMLGQSPDSGEAVPIVMTFEVTDSATNAYSGSTIAGPRRGPGSPHLKSAVKDHGIEWQEKNIGQGYFVYNAQLVRGDSIAGTVKLVGGNIPGPPYGVFGLVRQPSGARAR